MRKEHVWFWVLVFSAAVITGSTLGLLSNSNYIAAWAKTHPGTKVPGSVSASRTPGQALAAQSEPEQSSPASIAVPSSGTPGTQAAASLNSAEQAQVEGMLQMVGSPQDLDYKSQIQRFQEKNVLPVTGVLDSRTLDVLMRHAAYQRARQVLQ